MNISEQYAESVGEQLAKMRDDIQRITDRAKTTQGDTQAKLEESLDLIRAQQQKLEEQYASLNASGHENWDALVHMIEDVQHDMEEAISHVRLH